MINTKKFVLLVGLAFSCDTNWFLITDPGSKIVSITMAFIERLHAHCRDSMDYHSLNLAHACNTFYLLFMLCRGFLACGTLCFNGHFSTASMVTEKFRLTTNTMFVFSKTDPEK